VPSIDIIAGPVSDFPPDKHSDHDRLRCRHGEFKVLHFSPSVSRTSFLLASKIQRSSIRRTTMCNILSLSPFLRNDADIGDPAKLLDINAKNCAYRRCVAISKLLREILIGPTIEISKEIRDQKIMQIY